MSTEENKALVRRWFTALDEHNPGAVDEFLATDYVDHSPAIADLLPGRAGVEQANELLYAAFSNVTHYIDEQVAEGDKVMTRVVVQGTFTGRFLDLPPTGALVQIGGVAVHRIVNGKLSEHWAHVDMADFMREIGAESAAVSAPDG